MGVPVSVSLEASSLINFVPVDSVVGIDDLVGGHPLVSAISSLGHNSNPFSLDGTGDLDPLVSVVLQGRPPTILSIKPVDLELKAWPDGGVGHGESHPDGIAIKSDSTFISLVLGGSDS